MEKVLYSYKGYEYVPEEEIEEDNRKIFHIVCKHGTNIGWLPISPYDYPSKEFFEAWIDAGLPDNKVNCRPSLEELRDIAFTKQFEQELKNNNK